MQNVWVDNTLVVLFLILVVIATFAEYKPEKLWGPYLRLNAWLEDKLEALRGSD